MPSQIGYFDTLKSAAGKVFSYLSSITLTGTDGKTITVTQDTSLDEAVAMSSKAPKTATIAGDGTAGRVLRSIGVVIANGTDIAHVKCTTTSKFNGDVNAEQDNIGKDGITTGVWQLEATGATLTLLNAGLTGDPIGALGAVLRDNYSNTPIACDVTVAGGDLYMTFTNATTGAAVDITTLVDTGTFRFHVTYITSA